MPGPIVVGASTGAAGILRPLYRRALGEQLATVVGGFGVYRTDGQATGREARRHVVCSSLVDDAEQADRLRGRYLYVATGNDANQQAGILDYGYHGPLGYLEISKPLTTALPSGIEIEISAPLPCEQRLDMPGLNQIVNWALRACDIEYRLALTGDSTRSLSLLDYETFIDQNERADAVFDTINGYAADPLEQASLSPRVVASGAQRTLVTGIAYTSADSVELRVIRGGHTLINDGSGWTTSTTGLTSDTQAAAVPLRWVLAAGMCKALAAARVAIKRDKAMDPRERAEALDEIANGQNGIRYWRAAFARIVSSQFPQPAPHRRSARTFPAATIIDPWMLP